MVELIIKIHDDGKGRCQSFEAYTDVFPTKGYGETEEEAVEEYKTLLDAHTTKLGAINFSNRLAVAWDGTDLKEYDVTKYLKK